MTEYEVDLIDALSSTLDTLISETCRDALRDCSVDEVYRDILVAFNLTDEIAEDIDLKGMLTDYKEELSHD